MFCLFEAASLTDKSSPGIFSYKSLVNDVLQQCTAGNILSWSIHISWCMMNFCLFFFLNGLKEAIRLRTLWPEQLSFMKYKWEEGRRVSKKAISHNYLSLGCRTQTKSILSDLPEKKKWKKNKEQRRWDLWRSEFFFFLVWVNSGTINRKKIKKVTFLNGRNSFFFILVLLHWSHPEMLEQYC